MTWLNRFTSLTKRRLNYEPSKTWHLYGGICWVLFNTTTDCLISLSGICLQLAVFISVLCFVFLRYSSFPLCWRFLLLNFLCILHISTVFHLQRLQKWIISKWWWNFLEARHQNVPIKIKKCHLSYLIGWFLAWVIGSNLFCSHSKTPWSSPFASILRETSWANARVNLHSQVHFGSKKVMVLTWPVPTVLTWPVLTWPVLTWPVLT